LAKSFPKLLYGDAVVSSAAAVVSTAGGAPPPPQPARNEVAGAAFWNQWPVEAPPAEPAFPIAAPPKRVPAKPHVEVKVKNNSPRSIDRDSVTSIASIETVEMSAHMESLMNASPAWHANPEDEIAASEMDKLLEMASNRLLAGDFSMSMRYLSLAQQITTASSGYLKQ